MVNSTHPTPPPPPGSAPAKAASKNAPHEVKERDTRPIAERAKDVGDLPPRGGVTMRDRVTDRYEREVAAYDEAEVVAYRSATMGVMDEDTRDRVLAMGGDVTRASPVWSQALDDAEPGLTTTTGAYRTPIDPTTAAVPAPENSPLAIRLRGTPTVGSGEPGKAEELFMPPDVAGRPWMEGADEARKRDGARK
jgi:hypothetical protein